MENEQDKKDGQDEGGGEEVPLCPGCMEPVDKLSYYCPRCGEASGQLTPYIPFVNIRYNYSFYNKLWRRIWYERCGIAMKLLAAGMIIFFVPVMLVGLPFMAWEKIQRSRDRKST
jgi:hypothetical protein